MHAGGVTLLKGLCSPLHHALSWAIEETLDLVCWFRQRHRFGIVASLEVLFGFLVESLTSIQTQVYVLIAMWVSWA
jgi:hypothetical protein